jgi:hypothetical protein
MAASVRLLHILAGLLAGHGLLLLLAGAMQRLFPDVSFEAVGEIAFFVLALPALLLTWPFTPLLWQLRLMNAPGWFAWPKPLGIALAYAVWIGALLALAWAVRSAQRRRDAT